MSEPMNRAAAPRIIRGVLLFVGLIVGGLLFAIIILYDADPYAARDRYEHFKLALFGEWQPSDRCDRDPDGESCETLNAFEQALEDAADFTFFRAREIEGSGLSVHTGIRFATARDVVDGRVASQWCYVLLPSNGASLQIELAAQSADDPPVYDDLSALNGEAVVASGLTPSRLKALARSHCAFEPT